jgi:hypothetical protein
MMQFGDEARGMTSGYNLTNTAAAKPLILWEDKLLTMDVYAMPNTPMYGHIYCPQCARNGRQNMLTVRQEAKQMNFEPGQMPAKLAKHLGMSYDQLALDLGLEHVSHLAGVISVEKIACSWDGLSVCSWSVVIDNNIARNVPR